MALKLGDRLRETTTTSGTNNISLGGAVSGFAKLNTILTNGDTTYYTLVDGTNWEIGLGTYASSGDTLSRSDSDVLQSTNSDNRINLSGGNTDVFVTYPADKAVVQDASNVVNATFSGNITGTASEATSVIAVANNSANETVYLTFVDGATGTQGIETDTGLNYNPSTGMLTSSGFTGAVTGNASTSTLATSVTVTANNSANETVYLTFVDGATGTQGIETDTGLTYNPSTGDITTTGKILYSNLYAALDDLPSASTYHGMFAHVHATGKGYFAHGGAWIELANHSQLASYALLSGANFTGKIGVGITPSAWDVGTSGRLPVQVGFASISGRLNDLQSELSNNCYNVSTGNAPQWAGITRYAKTQMEYFGDGSIRFKTAPTVDQSTFNSSPNFTFTETVRIDGSGRLLTSGLTGTIGSSSAKLQASGTNAPSALLNRTNDGVLVDFYKNGSTNLGSIGMSGDGPSFGTATQHIVVHNGKAMPGTNTGSALDDTMDLGSSSSQFKNLYLSGTADATNFKINGGQGTDGQVLTSTGSGVAWEDASGGGGGGGSGVSVSDATALAFQCG